MSLLLRHLAQKWLGIYSDQCRRCKRWFFTTTIPGSRPAFNGFDSYIEVEGRDRQTYLVGGYFTDGYDGMWYRVLGKPAWALNTKTGPCDKCIGELYWAGEIEFDGSRSMY